MHLQQWQRQLLRLTLGAGIQLPAARFDCSSAVQMCYHYRSKANNKLLGCTHATAWQLWSSIVLPWHACMYMHGWTWPVLVCRKAQLGVSPCIVCLSVSPPQIHTLHGSRVVVLQQTSYYIDEIISYRQQMQCMSVQATNKVTQ